MFYFWALQFSAYAQSTWVKIQPGMYNNSILISGDTIITAGNTGDINNNYIHINYANIGTGNLTNSDTLFFKPERLQMESDWNILFANFNDFIVRYNEDNYIGFNYLDSAGSTVKWKSSVYSLNKNTLAYGDINIDTFNNAFVGIYNVNDKIFVINQWKDPDHSGKRTPNFEISSIDKWGNMRVVYQAINKNRGTWNMIRGIQDDNQSEATFFINRERAWDFRGVPMQYETDIMKMDTNGKFIWSAKLNYTDSLNMLGCQFVQKKNGNLLALWNNWEYRPYKHPEMSVLTAQRNDSCTLHFAEVDYETGKVIGRKSYRKYLFNHVTLNSGFLKSETVQVFILTDAIKVADGVVWAGYRSFYQRKLPLRIDMPFLFKTDFSGKPIWYRDYFVFPDSETDEGMLLNSFLQTPDGGFVLAGENRDFSRTDVQRSILVKVDSFGCLIPGCQKADNINEAWQKKCELYPNPTTSNFVVTLPHTNGTWIYKISDNRGKVLQSGQLIQAQNPISTQNLPNGIYQIILQNPKTSYNENHSFIIAR